MAQPKPPKPKRKAIREDEDEETQPKPPKPKRKAIREDEDEDTQPKPPKPKCKAVHEDEEEDADEDEEEEEAEDKDEDEEEAKTRPKAGRKGKGKAGRGPGRESPFTNEQRDYLESLEPEFDAKVMEVDPELQGANMQLLTQWKIDTVVKVSLNEMFKEYLKLVGHKLFREVRPECLYIVFC